MNRLTVVGATPCKVSHNLSSSSSLIARNTFLITFDDFIR